MRIPSMKEAHDKAFLTKVVTTFILVILFSVTSVFAQNSNPKQLTWETKLKVNLIYPLREVSYEFWLR